MSKSSWQFPHLMPGDKLSIDTPLKFYIAGPVSGVDGKNRAAFKDAADLITSNGHIALYTQLLPEGLSEADYMKFAHAMLEVCDVVLLLPRWSLSVGAIAEYHWAEKLEKKIVRLEHMPMILRWKGSMQKQLIAQATSEVRAMVKGGDFNKAPEPPECPAEPDVRILGPAG